MKLTLGFSPCPNDTFIFDAMVHGRVDTEGITFDYFLADVEELNRKAFIADVDVTKISYHAFAYVAKDYYILDSGSALGYKNGPLVISKTSINPENFASLHIAIPGKFTTANLLMSIAWPDATHKTEYIFSDIERAILSGEVDAGLIIHETRFTYQSKGLRKFADMGEYWERLTGLPIPLGSIVIKRNIPEDVALKVNRILKRSIDYAYMDSLASYTFVCQNAKEMDSTVMNNHIKLFVNEFTSNLGLYGRRAVETLYSIARERNVIPELPSKIFLTESDH
jgi:1,4-dihydroxy-6-naphthoate synthase